MKVNKMSRKDFHRLISALAEIAKEYREQEKQEKEEKGENENVNK